mmetsp:Transcript_13317/g.43855  ORF Transcript_13317/g.43855 Transcript_13317/m.43855 type:complete len:325 (+) Transcript_13317:334-1308(+)
MLELCVRHEFVRNHGLARDERLVEQPRAEHLLVEHAGVVKHLQPPLERERLGPEAAAARGQAVPCEERLERVEVGLDVVRHVLVVEALTPKSVVILDRLWRQPRDDVHLYELAHGPRCVELVSVLGDAEPHERVQPFEAHEAVVGIELVLFLRLVLFEGARDEDGVAVGGPGRFRVGIRDVASLEQFGVLVQRDEGGGAPCPREVAESVVHGVDVVVLHCRPELFDYCVERLAALFRLAFEQAHEAPARGAAGPVHLKCALKRLGRVIKTVRVRLASALRKRRLSEVPRLFVHVRLLNNRLGILVDVFRRRQTHERQWLERAWI